MAAVLADVASAPPPSLGAGGQPGSHRIPLDISENIQQMIIRLNREALETILIQVPVPDGSVSMLPTLGVGQGQPAHKLRKLPIPLGPED